MPHKHKRKREEGDLSQFDLAPNARARPLAAYTKASLFSSGKISASHKRQKVNGSKTRTAQDDTPKAFSRLMAWQKAGRKPTGLDDGNTTKSAKKKQQQQRKTSSEKTSLSKIDESQKLTATTNEQSEVPPTTATTTASGAVSAPPVPKILPGESLSSFASRVDHSIPLNASNGNNSNNAANLPADLRAKLAKAQRTTKHNKRLQRMQAEWRAEEARLQEKEADAAEEMEEQKEQQDLLWAGVKNAGSRAKKRKNSKGSTTTATVKVGGNGDNDDDDPWKDLEKRRREETKQKNLQDVVKAPPVLKKVKSKFKIRAEDLEAVDGKDRRQSSNDDNTLVVDVNNVPAAVGSLRRREELNVLRRDVIQQYRTMARKRQTGSANKKRGVDQRIKLLRPRSIMT